MSFFKLMRGKTWFKEDESTKSAMPHKDQIGNWRTSSQCDPELQGNSRPPSSDSSTLIKTVHLGGSVANISECRKKDFPEVEVRELHSRNRKVQSMIVTNNRNQQPAPVSIKQPAKSNIGTVLYEGTVKRTKYLENGKKVKKNWTKNYMILTRTALIFYKDEATYSKVYLSLGTRPDPIEEFLLYYASVVPCAPRHTKKYNQSLVLILEYDVHLIQDDTEDRIMEWIEAIRKTIDTLMPQRIPTSEL